MAEQPEKKSAKDILFDWCDFLRKYEPVYKFTADSMDQLADAALGYNIRFPRGTKLATGTTGVTTLTKETFEQLSGELIKVRLAAHQTDDAIRDFYNNFCRVEFGTGYLRPSSSTKERVESIASAAVAQIPAAQQIVEKGEEMVAQTQSDLEKLKQGLEALKKK